MTQATETNATATKYSWDDVLSEPMSPLLTRQYISGNQAMIARIFLKKDCVVPTHSHPNEQISYIVSGVLELDVDGTIHTVRAGEVLVIPGGAPHSARALEDTLNLDFFAPPRQDWLNNEDAYLRQPLSE